MTTLDASYFLHPSKFLETLKNVDLVDIVTITSLVLFLRFGFIDWYFELLANLALFLLLLTRLKVAFHWFFWFTAAIFGSLALYLNWDTADNHKYLFVYWMWIMTIVFALRNSDHRNLFIRFNARYFLILIFLGAAFQKFMSESYMSGEMFELITALDSRFQAFAVLLGIEVETLDTIKKQFAFVINPAVELSDQQIILPFDNYIVSVAKWITWYDIYVQVLIGILFLIGRRITDLWGHIVLLFFIFTTYIPAPVFGFGWTLSIMGIALSWQRFSRLTLVYLVSFFVILIYQIPWRDWILGTI